MSYVNASSEIGLAIILPPFPVKASAGINIEVRRPAADVYAVALTVSARLPTGTFWYLQTVMALILFWSRLH